MRKYIAALTMAAATVTAAPALAGGQYYGDRYYGGNAAQAGYGQQNYNGDRMFTVDARGNLRDRQGRVVTAARAERNGYYRDRDGYWRDRDGAALTADYASAYDVYRDRNGTLRDRRTGQVVDERYAANTGGYNGQTWVGNDGRTYCRRSDGTTGLLIGGAGGALLGRAIDGGRNKALGTILGGAAGAIAGRAVERGQDCR